MNPAVAIRSRTSTALHLFWMLAAFFVGMLVAGQMGCSTSGQGRNIDGVRNFQSGQYQQAIQDFQQALASNPYNANAYYNLGATYYAIGKQRNDRQLLTQAEGLYHQCLDLQPDHTDSYRGLAALLVDTDRTDSAFTLLKRWANRSPSLADPRIELARLYEEFGDSSTASRHLTDALQLDANNARAWTALGRIREQQGQIAQALSNYQQAYNLNQFQPGLAQRIASLQQGVSANAVGGRYGTPTQMVNIPQSPAR